MNLDDQRIGHFLSSQFITDQEAALLKNEITAANINFIKNNYIEIIKAGYFREIEIFMKKIWPVNLSHLIKKEYDEYCQNLYETHISSTNINIDDILGFISS